MTAKQPPRMATYILEHLGPQNDAVPGDLVEEYRAGRSAFWYWWQVLSAILIGVAADLRAHQLLAARSVILTWAVVIAWVESTWTLYLWVSDKWVYASVNSSVALFELWIPFGGGLCLIWCVGSALSGWISARLSGNHRSARVVASALAQIPLTLWWSSPVWIYWLHPGSIPRFSMRLSVPNLMWAAVVLIGMPTSTLLGGLWANSTINRDTDGAFS